MNENAFKTINENSIILDFNECKYVSDIHKVLKEKFGLPEYYGENWDALWDCLRYLFYNMGEYTVEIYDKLLDDELKDYCQPMQEIFDRVNKETPNVKFFFKELTI